MRRSLTWTGVILPRMICGRVRDVRPDRSYGAPVRLVFALAAMTMSVAAPSSLAAQELPTPDLRAVMELDESALSSVVRRYSADREVLLRRWNVAYSQARRARMRAFYEGWLTRLDEIDFESLGVEGRIDYTLLRSELTYELELLEREGRLAAELDRLVPIIVTVAALQEARRDLQVIDPRAAAVTLQALSDEIGSLRSALQSQVQAEAGAADPPSPILALRAARALDSLDRDLEDWFEHYSGYDPLFTWWVLGALRRGRLDAR